jgi:multidrug efflux pump subunit AcrA (membrane-fusion protein)
MKSWTGTMVGLALLWAGCGNKKQTEATQAAEAKPVTVTVSVVTAEANTVPLTIQATGSFVADESSDVAPKVAGRIAATPVDAGAFVKQGQVIVRMDSSDAELRLRQAKAQLEESQASLRATQSRIGYNGSGAFDPAKLPEVAAQRANYESAAAQARLAEADAQRYANLVATGDVSKSNYEKYKTQAETAQAQANASKQQYEASLNGARQSYQGVITAQASLSGVNAQLAIAQKGVDDMLIRAPFNGYVSARPVAVGQYVALTNKIATVVKTAVLKLQLQVPEGQAAKVKAGMEVQAQVAAYADRAFTGKVTEVNPSVDPGSRSFIVEAKFTNPDLTLRPGMFATGQIFLPGGEQAVFVPKSAVVSDAATNSSQVFVIDHGKARLRVVQVLSAEGRNVRVLAGVAGGEILAANRLGDLYEGCPVEVKP